MLTTVAGVLLAMDMAGAFLFVHMSNGVFVANGGWELVVVLGLFSLMVAATGAGRFSTTHSPAVLRNARPCPPDARRNAAAWCT